ncbi:MAG: 5'/3'-nucleotidase SurE [Prevotella sp.]|jgi:5'-nucleotidase|nr:5'/3'-nucleotidase SurE [Prevotella sp.]
MENKKPFILISNDDGYQAKGINSLVDMIRDMADILVCAPESGRSGMACAFSANDPLVLVPQRQEEGLEVWSCNGTPVDCVKLALEELCKERRPQMVIGGINHGDNASVNAHYSGTMGVTLEGCMKYIPSLAFSLCTHDWFADFESLRPYIRKIVRKVLDDGLPKGVCLNVNFPVVDQFKGVRICRMAPGTWDNEVVKCRHPRGYDYWWMVGRYTNDEPEAEDTDNWALRHGYIAITPTKIDITSYEMIEQMKNWDL